MSKDLRKQADAAMAAKLKRLGRESGGRVDVKSLADAARAGAALGAAGPYIGKAIKQAPVKDKANEGADGKQGSYMRTGGSVKKKR